MSDAKTLGALPAYPHTEPFGPDGTRSCSGITLRQHFAGLAMQALLTNQALTDAMRRLGWDDLEKYPRWAVEHADALLAKLAKESK